ncbi:NAC domain-containing protein [Psidium guajava]|nr:NAC domain-containing protein [Psidium guajava]
MQVSCIKVDTLTLFPDRKQCLAAAFSELIIVRPPRDTEMFAAERFGGLMVDARRRRAILAETGARCATGEETLVSDGFLRGEARPYE